MALRRLVEGDLAGMFDAPTSGQIDLAAPVVSLNLRSVYESDALGILMICAAARPTALIVYASIAAAMSWRSSGLSRSWSWRSLTWRCTLPVPSIRPLGSGRSAPCAMPRVT